MAQITVENFLEQLGTKWLNFNAVSKSIEDRDSIRMLDILGVDSILTFWYKEMKINQHFEYLFSGSLDQKIKANCNYRATLFLNCETWNNNINTVYYKIEKDIKDCIEEIKKGWLFNSEDRYDSKIKTIIVEYKEALKDIKSIKADYFKQVEKKPNYDFGCSVAKIENLYSSVKRVDFILGIESFLKIANYWQDIGEYLLWLKEVVE